MKIQIKMKLQRKIFVADVPVGHAFILRENLHQMKNCPVYLKLSNGDVACLNDGWSGKLADTASVALVDGTFVIDKIN